MGNKILAYMVEDANPIFYDNTDAIIADFTLEGETPAETYEHFAECFDFYTIKDENIVQFWFLPDLTITFDKPED